MIRLVSFSQKHYFILVLAALGVVVAFLYSPALSSSFMGDDFNYLRYLFFNIQSLFNGQGWDGWLSHDFLLGIPWIQFRPLLPLFLMLDYLAWNLNPVGYHIFDFILHTANSFLVFLLTLQLTRSRWTAFAGGILFAIMPIHVEAVSWIAARADGLATIWYLLSILFFILSQKQARRSLYILSVLAFVMSLLSKEPAVSLPVMIILYDLLYQRDNLQDWRRTLGRYARFFIVLVVYMLVRFQSSGEFVKFTEPRLLHLNWLGYSLIYAAALTDPFLGDLSPEMLGALVLLAVILLVLCRKSRAMWFGGAWMVVTILPSFLTPIDTIYDRYSYLPTIGLAIFLSSLLIPRIERSRSWLRALAFCALGALVVAYGVSLFNRNEAFARGAEITRLIPDQIRVLHPSLPVDARLVFVGLPNVVVPRGVAAYGYMVSQAMQITFDNPNLRAFSASRFPMWLDRLDRSFFFEYNRRKLVERTDLLDALKQRQACADVSIPAVTWDFSQGAQNWQAWNDLSDFAGRDGTLVTKATGNDPYMASPEIEIPALAIGDIEIVMRVRSDGPTTQGAVYWLASSQHDFSPALQVPFSVQGDGEWHTYHVDIAASQQLLIGDEINQLRLDPTSAPADIALKSVRVFVHCRPTAGDVCACPR